MAYISNLVADLKYSQDEFPTIILNDGSITTLDEAEQWVSENLPALEKELQTSGALLFRGFPITNAETYDSFFCLSIL